MSTPALLLATLVLPAAPGDWPNWRGPHHDGVSRETGWSSAGREVWRANVGVGYSAPVVADGRVILSGHDPEAGEDTWYAFDAESGDALWTRSFPAELMDLMHEGGTITTAAVAGDAVFVTHRQGRGLCLDAATGEVRWERDYATELGIVPAIHGYHGSPVVADGVVIVSMGSVTFAAAPADGAVLWRADQPDDTGASSTPVPFERDGRALLADFATAGLVVRDRRSGSQLAFRPFTTEMGLNAASPVLVGDRLFISAAYGMGGELLRFTGDALEVEWGTRDMRNKLQSCVLWEDHLYGFDESMLKCLDLEGNERWRVRGLGMGALTASDGRLLVTTSRGELLVAKASPDGFEELARETVVDGGVCWTAPTLANGLVYVRNSRGELVCRDHRPTAVAGAAGATEEAAPAGPAPAAAALFDAHAAAVGGVEAWRAVEGLRLAAEVDQPASGTIGAPGTLLHLAPDALRVEVSLGPFGVRGHGTTSGEDAFAWRADPFAGPSILDGDEARLLVAEARLLQHVDWRAHYGELGAVQPARFDDRPCWRVVAQAADGGALHVFFERGSGLLAGLSTPRGDEVAYREYAIHEGLAIPRYRRRLAAGTAEEEVVRVTSVSTVAPDAAEVAPPDAVQRLLLSDEEIAAENARLTEAYADLLGTYVSNWEGEQDVPLVVHRGRLALRFGAGMTNELLEPEGDGTRWPFAALTGMWVEFQRDDEGAVTGLLMHSFDGESVWRRR